MPTRKPVLINVGYYVRSGQDVVTAIAQAIAEANVEPGAIVFIPPNVGAGGNLAAAGPGTVVMDYRVGGANLPVVSDNGLTFSGHTSGAGAQAGTLTNAPSAGNPAHWLKVVINNVNRFIPAW